MYIKFSSVLQEKIGSMSELLPQIREQMCLETHFQYESWAILGS